MRISFSEGLSISIFSMCIVFIALLLVSYIISLGAKLIAKSEHTEQQNKGNEVPVLTPAASASSEGNEDDRLIVPIIAAAVQAYTGEKSGKLEIRPLVRTAQKESAWTYVSRFQTMN